MYAFLWSWNYVILENARVLVCGLPDSYKRSASRHDTLHPGDSRLYPLSSTLGGAQSRYGYFGDDKNLITNGNRSPQYGYYNDWAILGNGVVKWITNKQTNKQKQTTNKQTNPNDKIFSGRQPR